MSFGDSKDVSTIRYQLNPTSGDGRVKCTARSVELKTDDDVRRAANLFPATVDT